MTVLSFHYLILRLLKVILMRVRRYVLPFTAIVGQEKMKKALILNAINPRIGGLLIRGEKGTGKSTAVRALADLLPEIEVVDGCPFNCNPRNPAEMCDICYEKYSKGIQLPIVKRKVRVVDLPLSATIDRVIGSLDIKKALKEGLKALDPGILAEANRGILYIDEVNLLDDYIADTLLDAAASGVNVVEREGVSVAHPAKFILVGTMNPEEGELRPQLLDRFGLVVEVHAPRNWEERVEIVKTVEEFEADPQAFYKKHEKKLKELRERIIKTQEILPKVEMSESLIRKVAEVCAQLGVSDRAEITIVRTAKTIAAFDGRTEVTEEDIKEAMEFALPHRMRKRPFEKVQLRPISHNHQSRKDNNRQDHKSDEGRSNASSHSSNERESPSGSGFHPGKERVFGIGEVQRVNIGTLRHRSEVKGGGRRVRVRSKDRRGLYVSSCIPRSDLMDIAFDATLRAAALRNRGLGCITIEKEDIREKVRYSRAPSLVIFLVDASGSMAAMRRMEAAKGAAISILNDAYLHRDQVAFIAFRGNSAEVLLPPTRNLGQAVNLLAELPSGGRTPLAAALLQSAELIKLQKIRKRDVKPVVVLISDGKANVPLRAEGDIREELIELSGWLKRLGANVIILDTSPNNALTFAPNYLTDIAYASEGQYIRLEDVSESSIYGVLRQVL